MRPGPDVAVRAQGGAACDDAERAEANPVRDGRPLANHSCGVPGQWTWSTCGGGVPVTRGLHSLTSELNLRTFGNTSLTLELISAPAEHILGLIWVTWGTK